MPINTENFPSSFADQFDAMLRARRATRVYKDVTLPKEEVQRFFELVLSAPSAFNMQNRAIVRIEDPKVREQVFQASGGQAQVASAPLLLAFIGEPSGSEKNIAKLCAANQASGLWSAEDAAERAATMTAYQAQRAEKGLSREFAIRDAMIAASFAMVTASAFGWSSSPMTGFSEAKVKEAIGAADTDVVVALLLAIGIADEEPANPGRFPVEERVYTDTYRA